jgi:hypothetical protein
MLRKDGNLKMELICGDYSCDSMKNIDPASINDSLIPPKAHGRYAILINNTKDKNP